jgi:hypothetical protein
VYASNNLHQFQNMNVTCHVTHWITAEELHDDAVWSPVRLTPQFDRDYQQLPIDGVTPNLKIPIVVTGMMFFFSPCCGQLIVGCVDRVVLVLFSLFSLSLYLFSLSQTMNISTSGATKILLAPLASILLWPLYLYCAHD